MNRKNEVGYNKTNKENDIIAPSSTVDESINFSIDLRGVSRGNTVDFYTTEEKITINSIYEFDMKRDQRTSINYFLSSLVGELMMNIMKVAKKRDKIVEDLESKLIVNLKNPLSLLDVRGYDQCSFLEKLKVNIYLYTDIEEEDLDDFISEVKDRSMIYNLCKDSLDISIRLNTIL